MSREMLSFFLLGAFVPMVIAGHLSYFADEMMVWCDPDPVLYSFQIVGLLSTILGIALSVWRAAHIRRLSLEDVGLNITFGLLVGGFCSFVTGLAWVYPMYGQIVMLIPRCY